MVCWKLVHPAEKEKGGRLTSDPNRSSLGLLPSGPDPVGEWLVHRQPPGFYIGRRARESKQGRDFRPAGRRRAVSVSAMRRRPKHLRPKPTTKFRRSIHGNLSAP